MNEKLGGRKSDPMRAGERRRETDRQTDKCPGTIVAPVCNQTPGTWWMALHTI